jgi:hypothetical protein
MLERESSCENGRRRSVQAPAMSYDTVRNPMVMVADSVFFCCPQAVTAQGSLAFHSLLGPCQPAKKIRPALTPLVHPRAGHQPSSRPRGGFVLARPLKCASLRRPRAVRQGRRVGRLERAPAPPANEVRRRAPQEPPRHTPIAPLLDDVIRTVALAMAWAPLRGAAGKQAS